jgi:hypothetical protein
MNTKQMMIVIFMIAGISMLSRAQVFYPADQTWSAAEKKRIEKGYAYALSRDHEGIVATALAVIVKVKMDLPSEEFPLIKAGLDRLIFEGATPVIRFKAYLTEAVFANPAMFKDVVAGQYSNEDALFQTLAQRMTTTLLSTR